MKLGGEFGSEVSGEKKDGGKVLVNWENLLLLLYKLKSIVIIRISKSIDSF